MGIVRPSRTLLQSYHGEANAFADEFDAEKLDEDVGTQESTSHDGAAKWDGTSAAGETPQLQRLHDTLMQSLGAVSPLPSPAATQDLLRQCKSASEVRRVLHDVVFAYPLCWDVLNGHGYRVAMITTLTAVTPKCNAVAEWFECVHRFRQYGFEITRTYVAEGLAAVRASLLKQFQSEGRTPDIISNGLNRTRQLLAWANEDRVVLDHVVYARALVHVTMLVSFFDRQNLYRSNFPDDFMRRDGIVVEWVVAHDRCLDYDQAVALCNEFVDEVLVRVRDDFLCRPPFSFLYRLMDYYFASDQIEKMISVLEETSDDYGVAVAESSTAKLMQLACAFNLPNVPELFLKLRATPPQCVIAAPDMSRLLFYYARAGGGAPCPECGERYNHRHQGLSVWQETTEKQKECTLFALARTRKSELEDSRVPPQCKDHSEVARRLLEVSKQRSIIWGALEWRGYLLCHMFCESKDKALEALATVEASLPEPQYDEFLRQTSLRVLRHHSPDRLKLYMGRFFEDKAINMVSPIVLQEGLMIAASIDDDTLRFDLLRRVWRLVVKRDSYVVPYTSRYIRRLHEQRLFLRGGSVGSQQVSIEEQSLVQEIVEFKPRSINLLDVKDGVSDFAVGSTKKNVFVSSATERTSRDTREKEREERKKGRSGIASASSARRKRDSTS